MPQSLILPLFSNGLPQLLDGDITAMSETKSPALIGLIGKKGSGKDTAADGLEAYGFQNVKFAGALKAMLRTLLAYQGVDEDTIGRMIDGDLKEVPTEYLAGKTPRFAMQTLGTEWGRNLIGPDFWLDTAMKKAATGDTVITDCRFPNEVEAVKSNGGTVIRIVAEGRTVFDETAVGVDHASETLMDELPEDVVIANVMAGRPEDIPAAVEKLKKDIAQVVFGRNL
jgi:hypothetical protein